MWNPAAGEELAAPNESILWHREEIELSYEKQDSICCVLPAPGWMQLAQASVTRQDSMVCWEGMVLHKDLGDLLLCWFVCVWDSLAVMVLTCGSRSLIGDGTSSLGLLMGQHQLGGSGLPPGHATVSCLLCGALSARAFAKPVTHNKVSLLARCLGGMWIDLIHCGPK